jgi:hypothetical protein
MRLDDFLICFFPDEREPLHIRGFSPKELPDELKAPVMGLQTSRHQIQVDKNIQAELKAKNQTMGLYFVPNSGGFKENEITRHNAVFCEIDNIPLIDQHDLYDNSAMPPNLRVETKKSVHAYWLLTGETTRAEWFQAQCGLIDNFKSDAGIKNPNRVMRLPFFSHLSWADGEFEYKRVEITHFDPETRFNIKELLEAYPYTAPAAPASNGAKSNGTFDNTIEGIANELRYRISQHPTYKVESDHVHGVAQGICHNAVFGKTALMVNLRTGAVFCHAGCDYWKIAEAFGIQKPDKANSSAPRLVSRGATRSETGRMLRKYVYGE